MREGGVGGEMVGWMGMFWRILELFVNYEDGFGVWLVSSGKRRGFWSYFY